MKETKTLLYVVLALVLFAVGFVGYSLFQAHDLEQRREQPPPSQPSIPTS